MFNITNKLKVVAIVIVFITAVVVYKKNHDKNSKKDSRGRPCDCE